MTIGISGAVVLVTGANGGLGREFVRHALDRGATKVYATARTPLEWDDARIESLALDVTDETSVRAAAEIADDTTIVINNAGVGGGVSMLGGAEELRRVFETNFFGAVSVAREFAGVLGGNGGGVILDVHSVLSWLAVDGAYSASKAALWSATNSLRLELAPQGTHVVGLHLGYSDTPMTANVTAPKSDPTDIVSRAYDGLERGEFEILADETSAHVKAALSAPIEVLYPQLVVPNLAP